MSGFKFIILFQKCGVANLFYLVEGSPRELKGNPGPEVASFLQVHSANNLGRIYQHGA